MGRAALVETMGAALRFDAEGDPEAATMQELLATLSPEEFVAKVTGLDATHPLYADIVAVVEARKA